MPNQLTTTNATVETSRRVSAAYSAIRSENGIDYLPALLAPDERKQIEEHRRGLHARLRPISLAAAEQDRAKAGIMILLGMYPNVNFGDRASVARNYLMAVMDQPLFAILEALDDFTNGKVFDIGPEGERIPFPLDRVPVAPRVLDQVKKRAAAAQEERYKCDRLLRITKVAEPEVPEEQRQRVGELMARLAGSMKIGVASQRKADLEIVRKEAQEARDRAARITEEGRRQRAHAG